jgi:ubiquinone/menaquinone biosynthesis C-methylase UbiE
MQQSWDYTNMQRIPEPELMTGSEQSRAYAKADFAEPHDRCIALLKESLPHLPAQGHALDLGCGPADITIRFARAFPSWSVDGLDGAPAMLKYGQLALQQLQLQGRVRLLEAYLPDGDAPCDRYDLIFSNSLLHHLADPMVLWRSIQRWSTAGTQVFVMDLMRPDTPETATQLVTQYAANEPEILRHDFYHSLLAAYRITEVQQQLSGANLGYFSVKSVSDRHFIVWGEVQ